MKFSIQTMIWALILIALVIVGALALRPRPVTVETAMVTRGDLRITVEEDGKTRIREKYIVSTPVSGRLSRIELKSGDEIGEQGHRIAVILPGEPTMLDARAKALAKTRVEQAHAAVKRAGSAAEQVRVDYDLCKSKYERAESMIQTKAISKNE